MEASSDRETGPNKGYSADHELARNRLGIAHLLLWTTTTAVVLAFVHAGAATDNRAFAEAYPGQIRKGEWVERLAAYAIAPACGAALAAVALTLWWLATRRRNFPSQPGHWLLLILSAVPLWTVGQWLRIPDRDGWYLSLFVLAILAALTIAAARSVRAAWWRLSFWLAGGGLTALFALALIAVLILKLFYGRGSAAPGGPNQGLALILALLAVVPFFCVLGAVLGAFVAAALDLFGRDCRDIFHWIGVVTLLTHVAFYPICMAIGIATSG